jgi:hypothetical protein
LGRILGRHWTWDLEDEEEDIWFVFAFSCALLAVFESSFVSLRTIYLLKTLG